MIILVFHLGIRKYYNNENFESSSFSPSSLWDLPSWFSFTQYHLLKSMLSIKARFSFLKQVCIQSLLEFSPFPLFNTSFHSILQVPRFTPAIKSFMSASVSLYVLYHTYCLFHYISHGLCYFIWLSFYMCVIFTWIDDVDSGGGQVYTWESSCRFGWLQTLPKAIVMRDVVTSETRDTVSNMTVPSASSSLHQPTTSTWPSVLSELKGKIFYPGEINIV